MNFMSFWITNAFYRKGSDFWQNTKLMFMLFKPSLSDISLSQHNNHRDGQFIKSVQKIAYLVLLKLPKYSWDPCLGLWISIGDNKWGDGCGAKRLHMCTTCSTSQPQHHPQQIFTGRKERESTWGQVVRTKTCPSNQGARRSTWHVPAISPICPVSPRRPNSPTHLV